MEAKSTCEQHALSHNGSMFWREHMSEGTQGVRIEQKKNEQGQKNNFFLRKRGLLYLPIKLSDTILRIASNLMSEFRYFHTILRIASNFYVRIQIFSDTILRIASNLMS
jgi:hypothetical protein